MIPIVCIVGISGSGKTTLLEKLLPELSRRGHRVATVKHHPGAIELDREGKDSWRHKRAGAHTAVVSTPAGLAMVRDVPGDLSLEEIRARIIQDVDLILAEGYKSAAHPKIEVCRSEVHPEPICRREDSLVAIVTDRPVELGVPAFGLDDAAALAEFIESRFLTRSRPPAVTVRVEGRSVPMKGFVRDFIAGAIRGMLGSLKECDAAGAIDIHLDPVSPAGPGLRGAPPAPEDSAGSS